jgi:hypothetical protein
MARELNGNNTKLLLGRRCETPAVLPHFRQSGKFYAAQKIQESRI